MLLELADHDGDVERAIEVLCQGYGVSYGGVVERLVSAGGDSAAIEWTDRAVADCRIAADDGNEFWLGAAQVARRFAGVGRVDDGMAVLRRAFRTRAGRATFDRLESFADSFGRAEQERAWAIDETRRQAAMSGGSGAALIDIALGEDDLDLAWQAAHEFGAGGQWQRLAEASRDTRPLDAAEPVPLLSVTCRVGAFHQCPTSVFSCPSHRVGPHCKEGHSLRCSCVTVRNQTLGFSAVPGRRIVAASFSPCSRATVPRIRPQGME